MIWILYYLLIALIFISGMVRVMKKRGGILTVILTPLYIIWSIIYMLHRDWVKGQTEFAYFLEELEKLSLQAFLILFLFIILISTFIYNVIILRKEKKYEK